VWSMKTRVGTQNYDLVICVQVHRECLRHSLSVMMFLNKVWWKHGKHKVWNTAKYRKCSQKYVEMQGNYCRSAKWQGMLINNAVDATQTKLMQWGWGKHSENKAEVQKNTEFLSQISATYCSWWGQWLELGTEVETCTGKWGNFFFESMI